MAIGPVKKHGIVWEITTNPNDKLPVEKIEIQAIREEILLEEVGHFLNCSMILI